MLEVSNKMLDSSDNHIGVLGPMRFGKTITGNILSAYYSKGCDSSEIVDSLKISGVGDCRDYLNKHNDNKVDVNSEYQNTIYRDMMLRKQIGP